MRLLLIAAASITPGAYLASHAYLQAQTMVGIRRLRNQADWQLLQAAPLKQTTMACSA
jgi:hypothetical protein